MGLDRAKLKELKGQPAPGRKTVTETLPLWGEVTARRVTLAERDRYEHEIYGDKADGDDVRARWIALCVCDADLQPVFGPGDLDWLKAQDFADANPLFLLCQRANGLLQSEEDLRKNSPPTPSSTSSSTSPA